MKPYIDKIVVKKIIQNDTDLSYLQQEYNDVSPELNEQYKKEDKERLESYGETWVHLGIKAEADIKKDYENISGKFTQILGNITSGGICGIESDTISYVQENIKEQIDILKGYLEELNIEIPKNVQIIEVEE